VRLLFVCTGNICRSPMAEGIARDVVATRYPDAPVLVESAGIAALDGHPATREAVKVMDERGIDISGHEARTLSRGMLASSDLVIVMEEGHGSHASQLAGASVVPAFLLLKLAEAAGVVLRSEKCEKGDRHQCENGDRWEGLHSLVGVASVMERNGAWEMPRHQYEVSDPIGMPVEAYRRIADIFDTAVVDVLRVLLETGVDSV